RNEVSSTPRVRNILFKYTSTPGGAHATTSNQPAVSSHLSLGRCAVRCRTQDLFDEGSLRRSIFMHGPSVEARLQFVVASGHRRIGAQNIREDREAVERPAPDC